MSVAREAHFDSEDQLHRAIAAHPEALPSEDVGLGPLVALANELDLGAGRMDLLAVDAQGRLVIIEFKRGTQNPDVRKVVAQVLDYGRSLWRVSYEALEQRCGACAPGFSDTLAEHVQDALHRLGENYDEDAFLTGVARCLETGSFVFLYVGRDLDERTRRIMTYLSDGARMTFFAVEVDHFHAGDAQTSVLVPRDRICAFMGRRACRDSGQLIDADYRHGVAGNTGPRWQNGCARQGTRADCSSGQDRRTSRGHWSRCSTPAVESASTRQSVVWK